ncbi:Hypoxia-responsive family protein, partial [Fagus crenata]
MHETDERVKKLLPEERRRENQERDWRAEREKAMAGCLWLSGLAGLIAYNWSQPAMKSSVKIIHA